VQSHFGRGIRDGRDEGCLTDGTGFIVGEVEDARGIAPLPRLGQDQIGQNQRFHVITSRVRHSRDAPANGTDCTFTMIEGGEPTAIEGGCAWHESHVA
jgi:hypothetical protein